MEKNNNSKDLHLETDNQDNSNFHQTSKERMYINLTINYASN